MRQYCLLALLFLQWTCPAWAGEKIETGHYILQMKDGAAAGLYLQDEAGHDLFRLGQVRFGGFSADIHRFQAVEKDGRKTWVACYEMPSSVPGTASLTATFEAFPDRVDVRYTLSGLPTYFVAGWSKRAEILFSPVCRDEAEILPVVKLGVWKRDAKGGLPLEHADGQMFPYRIGDRMWYLAYDTGNKINANWSKNESYRPTVFVQEEGGCYTSCFSILSAGRDRSCETVSAQWHGRPFALVLTTGRTYNWWEDAKKPMRAEVTLANTSPQPRACVLKYTVHNYAGTCIDRKERSYDMKAGEQLVLPIEIRPETERELYFLEVSVEDGDGREQAFTRTNLALLPSHQFHSKGGENLMGLSAYWAIPDSAELKRLLGRMGVRWLRNGNTHSFDNIEATFHNNINWRKKWKAEERDSLIRVCLRKMTANGNRIWEFGNELNMSSPDIAGAGIGIGKAELVKPYVEWLKAIRKVQQEKDEWKSISLISFGIAGTDEVFLDRLVECAGWDLLDGIALHPGRGNFTPDYPVTAPWEEFVKPDSGYQYWNYYGSIRLAKNFIKRHGGDKKLYLTEVYALDYPNHSWNDTPREAAENVLLSYALAAAEGVENALYYQLFNSVWFDHLGVRPENREYFFGMINRDLSFKPSLMAYCNTAEILDGARFKRWLRFDKEHPYVRGIEFDTPQGSLCILWDRSEGYRLNHPAGSVFPEPWVSSWTKCEDLVLPSKGQSVVLVNAIGQRYQLDVHQNKVRIGLTGGAVAVYGLDTSEM
ncbi:T9SS C-terminal target domain-containing protein [uncultured Bacteroides sp.]|jgi:hypothetical protein|uniref:T9SS C-terminal target domain-containing protein n=1 Tax=uncultured Bacteroides sp. TaxID=162156 RepID=UPI00280B55A5|nr:T9SS C-terminal target domain-containing protein [uncultured Bacteroides sp.]